jgi:hypothetical protein
MGEWFSLPGKAIEVRQDDQGRGYWRHEEPIPHPEGEGPYDTLEEAAQDGEDYANFVHGR